MWSKIATAFAVTAGISQLTAAMPTPNGDSSDVKLVTDKDVFLSMWNMTEEYSVETDNKWVAVDTQFPVLLFKESSTTMYISMNGLVSFTPPEDGCLSSSNRALPVGPSSDASQDPSCIPQNTVAAFWKDLWFPPNTIDLRVHWKLYDVVSGNDNRYRIEWRTCDKASSSDNVPTAPTLSGASARAIQLSFYQSKPGLFYINYSGGTAKHLREATIGAQSYPDFVQVADIPESVTDATDVCVTLDTNKRTTEIVAQACQLPDL
ncbi:hypothetical protein TWF696_008013 [Orbilia brochopaga]|uniref:Secreted protein n=1 Tax=Orbilia brochopaga TaxID=3140254 RepID=A0AAV9UMM1_9PEZI